MNCILYSIEVNTKQQVHAWDYRRYVLASMPTKLPEKKELAYTLKKIEENFSNFSAWHQRTKVLQSMWEQGQIDEAETKNGGKHDKGIHISTT